MSNKATSFMMFIFGAGIGSAIAWVYAKKKYELIAREEIESVREILGKRESFAYEKSNDADKEFKAAKAKEKPDILEYATKLKDNGYVNYSNITGSKEDIKEKETENSMKKPYVIGPDDFGEVDDYDNISLVYYADQVLADEDDELVENVEEVIGYESLTHFGEYEDDSVMVRNDILKCDYEILLDKRKYSDIIKNRPGHSEE